MTYIIFTYDGLADPIAKKLQDEGNEVAIALVGDKSDIAIDGHADEDPIDKERRLQLFENMGVPIVDAWAMVKALKRVTDPENYFLFFDFNYLWRFADALRGQDFNGNFPTKDDYLMEEDRDRAKAFAKKHYPQLKVADREEFSTIEEGKQFLQDDERFWVLKPKGDNARTVVPESKDQQLCKTQIVAALDLNQEGYETNGFILEEYIPNVVELTPQKVYYNGAPIYTHLDIENKPLGSGNLGMQTGCSMNLVVHTNLADKINQIAFPPIVDELAKKHEGLFIWDASLLIDSTNGDIYFGEFCPNRVGYDAFFTELCMAKSVSHYFESVMHGINPLPRRSFGVSVRVFNLHRSTSDQRILRDSAINNRPDVDKYLWLYDAYRNEENYQVMTTGYEIDLAVVTSEGDTIGEAVDKVYERIEGLSFEGGYFRPKFDFLSREYHSSILNRYHYALEREFLSEPDEATDTEQVADIMQPVHTKEKINRSFFERLRKPSVEELLDA